MPDLPLPELEGTSLVLIGSFNPRIFQPSWFVRNGLLPESAEEANVEIITNEVCAFDADWFRLDVLSDRLSVASTATPSPESLRDLLLGALTILRHTPVARLGLNTHSHHRLSSADAWHAFGHMIAPKTLLWDPILHEPGTRSLVIEGRRPDDNIGAVRVKVEPSQQFENSIFLETNDEYISAEAVSAEWAIHILNTEWENSR